MAFTKARNLSIALLFTGLAACGSAPSYNTYGGPGLPPSASRPLSADIQPSEARPLAVGESAGVRPIHRRQRDSRSGWQHARCAFNLARKGDLELAYEIDERRSWELELDGIGKKDKVTLTYDIILGPNPQHQSRRGSCRYTVN